MTTQYKIAPIVPAAKNTLSVVLVDSDNDGLEYSLFLNGT